MLCWWLQIVLGILLADLLTGMIHWFEDSYIDYCCDFPFFEMIAKDNELHHYYPRDIVSFSWWENIKTSLPFFLVFCILIWFTVSLRVWNQYAVLFVVIGVFSIFSNVLHKYSHMRPCETNQVIQTLQSYGFLVSHEQHRKHHETSNSNYCVNTAFLNPVLDATNFWRGLEHAVFLLTGKRARPLRKYEEYAPIYTPLHKMSKEECPRKITTDEYAMLGKRLKRFNQCKKKNLSI